MDQIDSIRKIIKETNKYEDLYNLPLTLYKSSNLLLNIQKIYQLVSLMYLVVLGMLFLPKHLMII